MTVDQVKIADLDPAPYNPRVMPEPELAKLQRSISKLGWLEPIVANRRTGRVIGGHQRLEVARRAGMDEVPVVWADMDERREMAANLALNRIHGEWDEMKLGKVLEELASFGDEVDLKLTGFDEWEVEKRMTAFSPVDLSSQSRLDQKNSIRCPQCGHSWIPDS